MATTDYDIVTVGGGVGGSSLARAMVLNGSRVLVLERETEFRDRVRGEWLAPWGVEEAHLLGIDDVLRSAGAHELPRLFAYNHVEDFPRRSPQKHPSWTFYHPDAQTALLASASEAGAEVIRGARVTAIRPGSPPSVVYELDGAPHETTARLVVAADGRTSLGRKAIGRAEHQHRAARLLAGVLLDDLDLDEEEGFFLAGPREALAAIFPQGGKRARAYVMFHEEDRDRLTGEDSLQTFIDLSVAAGIDAKVFTDCRAVGPLASFVADDSWVDEPYEGGVALIGDAAGISDPSWGMGLSLTFRDARVLRDCLQEDSDWEAAGHAYAMQHDEHYSTIVTGENWQARVLLDRGPEADALRRHVLPQWMKDPRRQVDLVCVGPDVDVSDESRRRFFAEDVPRS